MKDGIRKTDKFVFLTSRNCRETKKLWKFYSSCFPTNAGGINYQILNFDQLVNQIILDHKDVFKKIALRKPSADGVQFPRKYFEPLFEDECKKQLEGFVESDSQLLQDYKAAVAPFAKEELERIFAENSGRINIIICTDRLFLEDFFVRSKLIFELHEYGAWNLFDRVFHRKFYSDPNFVRNERQLVSDAKKDGSLVFILSRAVFSRAFPVLLGLVKSLAGENGDKAVAEKLLGDTRRGKIYSAEKLYARLLRLNRRRMRKTIRNLPETISSFVRSRGIYIALPALVFLCVFSCAPAALLSLFLMLLLCGFCIFYKSRTHNKFFRVFNFWITDSFNPSNSLGTDSFNPFFPSGNSSDQENEIQIFWRTKFAEWKKEYAADSQLSGGKSRKIKSGKIDLRPLRDELLEKGFTCEPVEMLSLGIMTPREGKRRKNTKIPYSVLAVSFPALETPIHILAASLQRGQPEMGFGNKTLDIFEKTDPEETVFYLVKIRDEFPELLKTVTEKKKEISAATAKYSEKCCQEKRRYNLLCTRYQMELYEICPADTDCEVEVSHISEDQSHGTCMPVFVPARPVFEIHIHSRFFNLYFRTEAECETEFESVKKKLVPLLNTLDKVATPAGIFCPSGTLPSYKETVRRHLSGCDFPLDMADGSFHLFFATFNWEYRNAYLHFEHTFSDDGRIEDAVADITAVSRMYLDLIQEKKEFVYRNPRLARHNAAAL